MFELRIVLRTYLATSVSSHCSKKIIARFARRSDWNASSAEERSRGSGSLGGSLGVVHHSSERRNAR